MNKLARLAPSLLLLGLAPAVARGQLAGARVSTSGNASTQAEGEASGEAVLDDRRRGASADAEVDGGFEPSAEPAKKPAPTAGPPADTEPEEPALSDHSKVVRSFAIGYFGMRDIRIGTDPLNPGPGVISAPVLGVRYWISEIFGVDVGMGFFLQDGVLTVPGQEDTFAPAYTGILVHAAMPLALASTGHFSFQVGPEVNVGLASSTIDEVDPDSTFSGSHWDVGVRGGGEVQFGFIDMPQLSLRAGIAFHYAEDNVGGEVDGQDFSTNTTTVATSVGNSPWDIFTGNVAALYYF